MFTFSCYVSWDLFSLGELSFFNGVDPAQSKTNERTGSERRVEHYASVRSDGLDTERYLQHFIFIVLFTYIILPYSVASMCDGNLSKIHIFSNEIMS